MNSDTELFVQELLEEYGGDASDQETVSMFYAEAINVWKSERHVKALRSCHSVEDVRKIVAQVLQGRL